MVKTIKLGMIYATAMMIIGIILFQIVPEQLLTLFNASETMMGIGVPALRIISTHFIFAGICIISISVLQALAHGFPELMDIHCPSVSGIAAGGVSLIFGR